MLIFEFWHQKSFLKLQYLQNFIFWFWRENCYFLGNFNTVFFFIFIGDAEKKQQMQELVNEGLKEMDKN